MRNTLSLPVLMTPLLCCFNAIAADRVIEYERDISPIFRKYCAGCHNDKDHDGNFSLENYQSLLRGTGKGPAVLAGDVESSRLLKVISGTAEPAMPPEGEAAPTEKEIALIRHWIEQGAKGPSGQMPDRLRLQVPVIKPRTSTSPITALDISPDGQVLAVARFGQVTILKAVDLKEPQNATAKQEWKTVQQLSGLPGKVTAVHFIREGNRLVTASGVAGSGGLATIWDWPQGKRVRDIKGHRDILFDAEMSPDGHLLATCSYDRKIMLWDLDSGDLLRTLDGHNGAVYDVAFSSDGTVLASASADDTCKVWRVSDGVRLDTLGQPLKEQYSVAFSPDGRFIAAGGADNRIRIWRFLSTDQPRINPLIHARFAHEGPIVQLAYSPDGRRLISVAEDRTIKIWETEQYTEEELIADQGDVAIALATAPDSQQFVVGRMDGSRDFFRIRATSSNAKPQPQHSTPSPTAPSPQQDMTVLNEQEPNDRPGQSQAVSTPAIISGVIHNAPEGPDEDYFQFRSTAGAEWVIEVDADRSKSELDSFVEILTEQGEPIERIILQAVRDSYFTFRGKNADQANDFRVFNWEEMELNEFLYCNGEVVKLWLYPRGPDSGFNVYPGEGKRWGYFDTTPLSHALGEPCYIVQPHPPGTKLIPNGLPVFRIYYQNDDESRRELGKDSKLFFTAPYDGHFLVRLRDVRGFEGEKHSYKLHLRPRKPDFSVNLMNKKLTLFRGSGQEFRVKATRHDQFDGPIHIHLNGFPKGYSVTSPVMIEAGQIDAKGVILAAPDAAPLDKEALKSITISATAHIDDTPISHAVPGFEELKTLDNPKLLIAIKPAEGGATPINDDKGPLEFVIHPGETIMLKVVANRIDFSDNISFGNETSGRNLPHGVIVDNIGLNGLLLLADQNEREFFLTASKWIPAQTRMFHLQTRSGGGHATAPVILHVRRPEPNVAGARK